MNPCGELPNGEMSVGQVVLGKFFVEGLGVIVW